MMKEEAVLRLTDTIAKFVAYTGKRLPDDVRKKLEEFRRGISEDGDIQFQDSKRGYGNKLQMCDKGFI